MVHFLPRGNEPSNGRTLLSAAQNTDATPNAIFQVRPSTLDMPAGASPASVMDGWAEISTRIPFPAIGLLGRLRVMRAGATARRVWRLPVCALLAVVLGGVFPGRTAAQPRSSRVADTSAPKAPTLAPDAPLPPSTPAFSPLGPDLVGRVVSTQGDPIAGARVFSVAAGPRVGRGYT